jgi:K+-sensing histidine kinase KdpD
MHSGDSRLRWQMARYALAIFLVAAAVGFKWKFAPSAGRDAPFLLLFLPTLIATRAGGLGPGLTAAALSTASASVLFMLPQSGHHWSAELLIRTGALALETGGSVALVAWVWSSRKRLEAGATRTRRSYEISAALGRTTSFHEVSDIASHGVMTSLNAHGVAVFVASDSRTLRPVAYPESALLMSLAPEYKEVPLDGATAIAFAARMRAAVFLEDKQQWRERFPQAYAKLIDRSPLGAMLCAPMVVADRLIGVLVAVFTRPRRFDHDDRLWSQAVAQDCAHALDRVRLRESEQHARAEAQDASRAKDEFLSVVSHELRAPVTTIAAWIDVLRARTGDRALWDRGLRIVTRSAEMQARLVEGLVELSRVVARKLKTESESFDISPLVRRTVDNLRPDAAAEGVELAVGPLAEGCVVADALRLQRLMHDFISSAVRSTPPGGHVRVVSDAEDGRVVVRIQSDGRGLNPTELAQALAPDGPRLPGQRDPIGLAIAKYIVASADGGIHVESPGRDQGRTVTIDLPIHRPAAEPAAARLGEAVGPR